MEKIALSKSYIFEGNIVNKNTVIRILNEEQIDKYNNMLTNKEGNMVNDEDFNKEIDKLIDELKANNIIPENNQTNIINDIIRYCQVFYARNFMVPSIEDIMKYIKNRDQSFATN